VAAARSASRHIANGRGTRVFLFIVIVHLHSG
jgi:hypothetical protein